MHSVLKNSLRPTKRKALKVKPSSLGFFSKKSSGYINPMLSRGSQKNNSRQIFTNFGPYGKKFRHQTANRFLKPWIGKFLDNQSQRSLPFTNFPNQKNYSIMEVKRSLSLENIFDQISKENLNKTLSVRSNTIDNEKYTNQKINNDVLLSEMENIEIKNPGNIDEDNIFAELCGKNCNNDNCNSQGLIDCDQIKSDEIISKAIKIFSQYLLTVKNIENNGSQQFNSDDMWQKLGSKEKLPFLLQAYLTKYMQT